MREGSGVVIDDISGLVVYLRETSHELDIVGHTRGYIE